MVETCAVPTAAPFLSNVANTETYPVVSWPLSFAVAVTVIPCNVFVESENPQPFPVRYCEVGVLVLS